jgi:hypothetical protein
LGDLVSPCKSRRILENVNAQSQRLYGGICKVERRNRYNKLAPHVVVRAHAIQAAWAAGPAASPVYRHLIRPELRLTRERERERWCVVRLVGPSHVRRRTPACAPVFMREWILSGAVPVTSDMRSDVRTPMGVSAR